ncbi:hypothetical protein ROLI_033550 [Roseobacter fucihabitans]|uniref:Uncharacterized protein n=1 Tax=Roseobacter fucihabitans TaxID=1537242 RepID=A0ABZ2BY03_9RHOB|nr:hypothetical protein [Roseobacter litoralis]MBC6966773.1 hypothetical protein [Roseobacter litoralis]
MKMIFGTLYLLMAASQASAGCQEHWDARGLGSEMQGFCSAVENTNSDGLVVIMKKKPKGCSPKGPTSDCNPASSILQGDGAYNGLMWFDADGGFGFDMQDRQGQDGALVAENGGAPRYYHELEDLSTSGAIETHEIDADGEWFVVENNGSDDLRAFNSKLMQQNSWVTSALQNGTNVIFLQQEQ